MRVVLALVLTALAASYQQAPPKEAGPFRAPDLVELTTIEPTIKLDIRYYKDWKAYPILDIAFAEITPSTRM